QDFFLAPTRQRVSVPPDGGTSCRYGVSPTPRPRPPGPHPAAPPPQGPRHSPAFHRYRLCPAAGFSLLVRGRWSLSALSRAGDQAPAVGLGLCPASGVYPQHLPA